ncbi:cytochrome c oxidase assembly protein [Patulibacter brassicae]|jgi:cytochrome c oxidase assembly factor CtaG|uniref:Cytochrome c oxidase assembly protein n=1 Tax=Patulibacter brassicae TaxID=1705717 RepID=A0ABU4VN89_9ACTN|nr:cytochrome c oxidase assembly protein [Patulibacter brassicae]MDX8153309.1 cytochrome c oxidase assembly protein [Patulibacter brassicae]
MNWLGAADGTLVPVALAATASGGALLRLAGRPGWTSRQRASLAGALALTVVVLAGPLEWLGEERLMSAHMVQHLLAFSAIPALLLAGTPRDVLLRVEQHPAWRWIARPSGAAIAAAIGVVVIWGAHVPPVLDGALERPPLTDLGHLALIAVGVVWLWPIVGPSRLRGFRALGYLAVTDLLIGVLGIWLAWYPSLVYDTYQAVPPTLGIDAENDQALAGGILLVVAEPFLAIEVVRLFLRALSDSDEDEETDAA